MILNLKATVTGCVLVPLFCSHCIKERGFEKKFLAKEVSLDWMGQKCKCMLGNSAEGLEELQAQEGWHCEKIIYSSSKMLLTKKDQGQHCL